ncbi:MAG: DUF1592 domain-containing protein [Pirellulales bacterium]
MKTRHDNLGPFAAWLVALLFTLGAPLLVLAAAPDEVAQPAAPPSPFDELGHEYETAVTAIVRQYCLDCHSTDAHEGELDLERFPTLQEVRHDPPAWQKVAEILDSGEMPPDDSPQPTADERSQLREWTRRYLDAEARAAAGDPGPVVLRRLNNAEYTYTIRDLTGVPLSPAAEFPVDGAAGEGFTNTGSALSMSPSLVTKHLAAAKDVAAHAVLLPDGVRFSTSTTRRDWTNEILASIRGIYVQYTGRVGDANSLNHWDVTDPTQLTDRDGRVNLEQYLRALLDHRQQLQSDPAAAAEVARQSGLSEPYLGRLAETLLGDEPESLLLAYLQRGLVNADIGTETSRAEAAHRLAGEIRTWQDQLWAFNPVGHFGQVKPWQEAIVPVTSSQGFRIEFDGKGDGDDVTLHLVAASPGGPTSGAKVVWQAPRIERPGRPPLMLRDLRTAVAALEELRRQALPNTAAYLAAAFEARGLDGPVDTGQLAKTHDVSPLLLDAWMQLLGVDAGGDVAIHEYLNTPLTRLGGYDAARGWMIPGVGDLSIAANSSDDNLKVPGDLDAHSVAVHPRPERWIAVGWKSPTRGNMRLTAHVKDAHAACGNGVSWSLELRHGSRRNVLASGDIDNGAAAEIPSIEDVSVHSGDLISLVIAARDQNHGCDLTKIDLAIEDQADASRRWSLTADCADSIDAGNPHADQYGNLGVWHFYTGLNDDTGAPSDIVPGSLLAHWVETTNRAAAGELAEQIAAIVSGDAGEKNNEDATDTALRDQLTSLGGPLFSRVDTTALVTSQAVDATVASRFGLDPLAFGNPPEEDLVVASPSVTTFTVPRALATGAVFAVNGALTDEPASDACVQLLVTTSAPPAVDAPLPSVPLVAAAGSAADARLRRSLDDFREIFPAAMCYPQIVPVDVVVTLVLFHREDEPLRRLMLTAAERAKLDRLWDELRYVSQDALAIVTGFEQLLEFASQDDDPAKYEPLGEEIYAHAAAFRQRLVDTEPAQLDALRDIAAEAYRRPLTDNDITELRALYSKLRAEELPHEDAWRLTLARVLTSPQFLYRLEEPQPGAGPCLVNGNELASRLSYFLWSSAPDEALSRLANSGELLNPEVLQQEAQRMLGDPRVRRLAIEFACQWLHVRGFDESAEKNEQFFPEFAAQRADMYEETVRFFTGMFQGDGSVLDLVGGDHTFLNERLAAYYGVPDVTGDNWRRVDGVGIYGRGGILTQATTLSAQSGASRTSPILRGNWISETLLGERSPRPPKGVPVLAETVPENLTERQLIEQHSSDASCAKCHARIDPYGFALESFDTVGRRREVDGGGHAIDTRTTLVDGNEVDGLDGLRQYLLTTRRDDVLHQFCRKLLGYALGRSVQLSDEPLLEEMLANLAKNDYRFASAVQTIILSDQFRMIRGRDFREGAVADMSGSRNVFAASQSTFPPGENER